MTGRVLPVLGLMLVLGACGNPYTGSTVGQQVESWATTSPDPKFATAVSTLQADMRRIGRAQSSDDEGVLRTDCDVLVTDALSANQNLPTPDSQLTNVLSRTYASAANAGRDCLCAAGGHTCTADSPGKANLLRHSAGERTAAERGFIKAEARVDVLAVASGGRR